MRGGRVENLVTLVFSWRTSARSLGGIEKSFVPSR